LYLGKQRAKDARRKSLRRHDPERTPPRRDRAARCKPRACGKGLAPRNRGRTAWPFLDDSKSAASWLRERLLFVRDDECMVEGFLLEADHFGEAQAGQ